MLKHGIDWYIETYSPKPLGQSTSVHCRLYKHFRNNKCIFLSFTRARCCSELPKPYPRPFSLFPLPHPSRYTLTVPTKARARWKQKVHTTTTVNTLLLNTFWPSTSNLCKTYLLFLLNLYRQHLKSQTSRKRFCNKLYTSHHVFQHSNTLIYTRTKQVHC